MEKKAAEKALEKVQAAREEAAAEIAYDPVNESRVEPMEYIPSAPMNYNLELSENGGPKKSKSKSSKKSSSGGLLSKMKSKKEKDEDYGLSLLDYDAHDNVEDRPAFSTQHNSSRKKGLRPREVAVPYSKLRKDRFFDWPPDPTVSRATPVIGPWTKTEDEEADGGAAVVDSPSVQPIPGGTLGGGDEFDPSRRAEFMVLYALPARP